MDEQRFGRRRARRQERKGDATDRSAKLLYAEQWNADILKLHALSGGALQAWVVDVERLPVLFIAAIEGVPVARYLIDVISLWLERAANMPASSPALCLNCDTALRPPDTFPDTYIVHLPFANEPKAALVNALCVRCANDGSDWRERSHQLLRRVFPDAYRVEYPQPQQ
jgi:hypothetical protein